MISFKNLRLWLTTIGVFLLMGSFISYLQAEKGKAYSASTFTSQAQSARIKTVEVNLEPAGEMVRMMKHTEHPSHKIAIINAASYKGLTITPLKKALLGGGYENLLKADSNGAVTGTYVFAHEKDFPLYEFVLKPLIEATLPHTSGDVGFAPLSTYTSFVANHGMQNTPLNATESYIFDKYTGILYQNHSSLAGAADIVIVIGNRE